MSEKQFRTVSSNLNGNHEYLEYDWLNTTYFEPIQNNTSGTPGRKVLPVSRNSDSRFETERVRDFTHG